MFTGSGMPMRFADLDGTMIDVYQAATQMTDESGQTLPVPRSTRCSTRARRRGLLRRLHRQHAHRNAVDHGIETPAERLKAGKREIGILSSPPRQSGNQILIDIQDDGRGIDGKKLVDKAIAAGLDRAESEAAHLSPREQLALIFEAGLSTASEVTAISGRGVGMDVVRSNIERIGGHRRGRQHVGAGHAHDPSRAADADHHPGADGLRRRAAFRHSALGDRRDRSCQRRVGRRSRRSAGQASRRSAAAACPRSRLPTFSAFTATWPTKERSLVVLRPAGGDVYALAVDRIHDHEELVVKPAAPAVMATGLYAGTTLADDGSPILLFDPAGIGRGRRCQARSA